MEYSYDLSFFLIVSMYLLSVIIPVAVNRIYVWFCLSAPVVAPSVLDGMGPDDAYEFIQSIDWAIQPKAVDCCEPVPNNPWWDLYNVICAFFAIIAICTLVDPALWMFSVGAFCVDAFHLVYGFSFLLTMCVFSLWSVLSACDRFWWYNVPWSSSFIEPVFLGISNPTKRLGRPLSGRERRIIRRYRRNLRSSHCDAISLVEPPFTFKGKEFFDCRGDSDFSVSECSSFCDYSDTTSCFTSDEFYDCFQESYNFETLYGDQVRTFTSPWVVKLREALNQVSGMPGVDGTTAKLIEKIGLWLIALSFQESVPGAISVTSLFISSMYKESTALILLQQIESVFGDEYTDQAGADFMVDFRILLEAWRESRNSELAKRFRQLLSLMVCCGVTDKLGLSFDTDAHTEFYKTSGMADMWAPDLVAQCLETCLMVWDRGSQYWATKDIRSLFSSNYAAIECDKEHAFILAAVPNYIGGTLAKLNMTEVDYDFRLEQLLETTGGMHARSKGPERHILARRLLDIQKAISSIAAYRRDCTMREKPFGIKIFGKTGQGKTTAIDALCNAALRLMKLPPDKRLITSVNGDDKYQSDVSTRHVIVKFDDMSNTRPERQTANPGQLVIDCLNNEVKPVLKADLNEKGKVFWNCKLVLITTNVEDLDAGYFSNEPAAVLRRIEMHVTQRLKPAFATSGRGLGMVNPVAFQGEVLVDAWDFDIKLFCPSAEHGRGDFDDYLTHVFASTGQSLVCKNISLDQLIKVFGERFMEHRAHQQLFMAASSSLFELELCAHNSYAKICSACAQEFQDQVLEFPVLRDMYTRLYVFVHALTPQFLLWDPSQFRAWVNDTVQDRAAFAQARDYAFFRPFMLTFVCAISSAFATFCPLYLVFWAFGASTVISVPVGILASFVTVYTTIYEVQIMISDYVSSFSLADARKKMVDAWWNSTLLQVASGAVAGYCAIRALSFFWNMRSKDFTAAYNPNGNTFSPPVVDPVPVEDFWTPNQPKHQTQEAAHDVKTMTRQQVHSVVASQLGFATFSNGTKNAVCDVLLVCTNYILVPYHVTKMTGGFPTSLKIIFTTPSVVGSQINVRVSPLTVTRIGTTDVGLMYVGAGGTRKDLLKFFPASPITDDHHVVSEVYRGSVGECCLDKYATKYYKWVQPGKEEEFDALLYNRSSPTFNGLCGAVLISERNITQIMGVHTKGKEGCTDGVACMLTRPMIESALLLLSSIAMVPKVVSNEDTRLYIPNGYSIDFSEMVHDRSPCHWLPPESNIISFGAHTGARRRPKSHVVSTVISPKVEEFCHMPKAHGPSPHLGTRKIWYDNLLPMTFPMQLPHEVLNMAYVDRRDEILGFLKANPSLLKYVAPVDIVTACSGADGVRGVDRMPQSTSMGWPICKPKSEFFIPLEPTPECSAPLTLPPEMLAELEVLREKLATRSRINSVFYGCPKDEPTKYGKEKVRIFAACPWYLSILIRQYYLPIARLYLMFPTLFESAVGVNAHGPAWEELITFMSAKGKGRMIFGDYEAFDKKVAYLLAILPWKLWIDIASLAGYSESSLYVMAGLAEEVCRPNYEFNGEVLATDGTTPSGHNMTVFSNCEINGLYLRSAFYSLAMEQKSRFGDMSGARRSSHACVFHYACHDKMLNLDYMDALDSAPLVEGLAGRFARYVNLLTYGDDNGMSVDSCVPWFNHVSVSKFLRDCGINFTTAQKQIPTVPYSSISDLSFLKRGARYDVELGALLAPLEMSSIYKSLHCRFENKEVTDQEYDASAIEGALLELFLHGEEVYTSHRDGLQKVVDSVELAPWLSTSSLKSYVQQKNDWCERYRPTSLEAANTPKGGV